MNEIKTFKEYITESKSKWELKKSTRSGINKGINLLVYSEQNGMIEIARTSENTYSISYEYSYDDNETDNTLYDMSLEDFDKSLKSKIENDFEKIPSFPKKMIKNLDVLKDEEEDWGSK